MSVLVEEGDAFDLAATLAHIQPEDVRIGPQRDSPGQQRVAQSGDGGRALGADGAGEANVEAAIVAGRPATIGAGRATGRRPERGQAPPFPASAVWSAATPCAARR